MDEPPKEARQRQPYEPPAILFEEPTEALAAGCTGSADCPSKNASTACDVLQSCVGTPNS